MSKQTLIDNLSKTAWDVPVAIARASGIPLDKSSVFANLTAAQDYASNNAIAYMGQIVAVLGIADAEKGIEEAPVSLYYIDENKVLQEVGGKVTADEATITVDEETGVLSIFGTETAQDGNLPIWDSASNTIVWKSATAIGATNTITNGDGKSIETETDGDNKTVSIKGFAAASAVETADQVPFAKADGIVWQSVYTKEEVDQAFTDADVSDRVESLESWKDGLKISRKYQGTDETAIASIKDIEDATASLSGAMHFIGVVEALPESGNAGDVVLLGNKEYVWDDSQSKYVELGDESIYAVKGAISDSDVATNASIQQTKIAATLEVGEGKSLATDISALNTAISEEVSRATGVESGLQTAVETAQSAAEAAQSAAEAAQGKADANEGEISTIKSDVEAIETVLGVTENDGLRAAVTANTASIGTISETVEGQSEKIEAIEGSIEDIQTAIAEVTSYSYVNNDQLTNNGTDLETPTLYTYELTLQHNLNTKDISVNIYFNDERVFTDVTIADENNIKLNWLYDTETIGANVVRVVIKK